jgi:predicted RNA-binding Zn-ribbon protein involved in translation (DUF1610 family)
MPELINCFECNQGISSEARSCPHCGTQFPQGRQCAICLEWDKDAEGFEIVSTYPTHRWVHPACYNEVQLEYQSVQYTCPVCKNVESYRTESVGNITRPFFTDPCPKCGQGLYWLNLRTEICFHCQTFLFPVAAERNTVEGCYVHRKCEASRKAYLKKQSSNQGGCLSSIAIMLLCTLSITVIYLVMV